MSVSAVISVSVGGFFILFCCTGLYLTVAILHARRSIAAATSANKDLERNINESGVPTDSIEMVGGPVADSGNEYGFVRRLPTPPPLPTPYNDEVYSVVYDDVSEHIYERVESLESFWPPRNRDFSSRPGSAFF